MNKIHEIDRLGRTLSHIIIMNNLPECFDGDCILDSDLEVGGIVALDDHIDKDKEKEKENEKEKEKEKEKGNNYNRDVDIHRAGQHLRTKY